VPNQEIHIPPPTPRNLLHLHQLLQINENQHFSLTFQAQPNLYKLILFSKKNKNVNDYFNLQILSGAINGKWNVGWISLL